MSAKELAEALGRTEQSVTGYIRRGMPQDSIEAAREWIAENIKNNGPPTIGERKAGLTSRRIPKNELDEEEQRARIRKLDSEAEAKELKNAVARSELYVAADVDLAVSELCNLIRARLESIPNELESEWPADVRPQVTARLGDKIYLILTEMSQWRLQG